VAEEGAIGADVGGHCASEERHEQHAAEHAGARIDIEQHQNQFDDPDPERMPRRPAEACQRLLRDRHAHQFRRNRRA